MAENLALSFYWFTSNAQWTALIVIVLPKLALQLVGPDRAGSLVSFLSAVGALLASVAQPLYGTWSDHSRAKWGRRRPFMVVGVAGSMAALVIMGLSRQVRTMIVAYLMLELFGNLASSPYQALIPDVVSPNQRGEASGYMGLMSQAAIIVGVLLPSVFPIATSLMVLAGLQMTGLIVTLAGVREPPSGFRAAEPAPWHRFFSRFWLSPREHADWWWVFITRFLVMLGFSTLESYLYYYLHFVQALKNPEPMLDRTLIVVTLASLLSVWAAGWLSDRVQRRKPMVITGGILMGLAAVGFVFSRNLWAVLGLAVVFGLGYGTYLSTDWALAVDVLPRHHDAAKDMGLWAISQTLAQTVATFIAGLVLTAAVTSRGPAVAYELLFLIAFGYFVLGSVLITRVRRVR